MVGRHVFARRTGTAVNECEIALVHSRRGNRKPVPGTVGNVVQRVVRRLVVGIRIDAEHGEIARMTGPHPVVRIAAELTDGRGRSTHEPHVAVGTEQEKEILVAVIERFHRDFVSLLSLIFLQGPFLHPFDIGRYLLLAARFIHIVLHARKHPVGHILHPDEKRYRQAGIRKLLLPRHGPEAVGQVVVLQAAVALYLAVSAVMVGQQQSLGRHQLARTAASEKHHGIFQRRLIHAVNVFGRKPEALGFHVVHLPSDKARQPHALVGQSTEGCRQAPQKKE